jgi:hypothetical protein
LEVEEEAEAEVVPAAEAEAEAAAEEARLTLWPRQASMCSRTTPSQLK